MIDIHTVAAGGGSILHFDGAACGSDPIPPAPTPARRATETVDHSPITDCNVVLGRLRPEFFPRSFGLGRSAARCRGGSFGGVSTRLAAEICGGDRASSTTPHRWPNGFLGHRRRQHGQRDQEDLGAARPRRQRLHAGLLRRRRRPARLPRRRSSRDRPGAHPSPRRCPLRSRHRPGRRAPCRRSGGRAVL